MAKIILDAGHGGNDVGAKFENRYEKDDNLRLVRSVGRILEDRGHQVYYTRTSDTFISPTKRAEDVENIGADLLLTIHRGWYPYANEFSGASVYLYDYNEEELVIADSILDELQNLGFQNNGIGLRRGVYLLRNSSIPSIELVVGYINSEHDNELFDTKLNEISKAIADGIINSLPVE